MIQERFIANRYRLTKSLGKGTFGEVFEALDEKFQPARQVAIKILHPQFLADKEVRDSIRLEAGNLARFSHPNILRVHDFEVSDELAFIVTDIATGGSLMDKLRPNPDATSKALPFEEVLHILQQISGALDEAHANGLIHRDIKPQNILLDKWNNCLLADFGLATAVSSTATAAMINAPVIGTPLFMAPEQWEGNSGKASDIYALGVLAYQMLTGEAPYKGNNMALAFQHMNGKIPKLSDKAPQLNYPAAVDDVLAETMAKKPEDRPKSATAFYQSFKQAFTSPHNNKVEPPVLVHKLNIEDLLKEIPAPESPPITAPVVVSPVQNKTANRLYRPEPLMLSDHLGCVNTVVWSGDGSLLASASFDRTVQLWRANGVLYATLQPHYGDVQLLAWSKDGKQIVTGCENGAVTMWGVYGATTPMPQPGNQHVWGVYGSLLANLGTHKGRISDIQYSPNGQRFAVASFDRTITLWRADTKAIATLTGHTMAVKTLAWSPNGMVLASASADKTVRLWSDTGKLLEVLVRHNAEVWDVAWAPNGRLLATAGMDGQVCLWMTDGRLYNICLGHSAPVAAVAWSPHGHLFATASWDKRVFIWQSNGMTYNILQGHKDNVTAVAWSPDGNLLASASNDETVRLWGEDGTLKAVLEGHKEPITALAWSPDGQILATASADCRVGLWTVIEPKVYEWPL
jgi:WD40 repeat protein